MAAVGWYRLPSGQPFHGTIPPGVVECAAPGAVPADSGRPATSARKDEWRTYVLDLVTPLAELLVDDNDQPVDLVDRIDGLTKTELIDIADQFEHPLDPGEDDAPVPTEVPGDQLGPDPEQLGTPPHPQDATG